MKKLVLETEDTCDSSLVNMLAAGSKKITSLYMLADMSQGMSWTPDRL